MAKTNKISFTDTNYKKKETRKRRLEWGRTVSGIDAREGKGDETA